MVEPTVVLKMLSFSDLPRTFRTDSRHWVQRQWSILQNVLGQQQTDWYKQQFRKQ